MLTALLGILVPVAGGAAAFLWTSNRTRPLWLPGIAGVHLLTTLVAVTRPPVPSPGQWLQLDPPGRLVLLLVSTLFATLCHLGAVAVARRSSTL